ncbi:hypothetical protein GCM10011505_17350 [Tistrella bauzanensis]|uniref:ATPase AAA-type core domain-containing protein n=1 Tax=Tistrella bauzanensis TaxID=657419 RepID=A0ABQ1IDP5_9PROT|nr:DUF3696 domain-containing protein [Tistrella bauzanensis]GGB36412.1 hypothetical protein GCM10011505_17350 [Tistrella bauzanensis]
MLTSIRLRNLKAWEDSGDIALAPLTLLYGANGAGKSSIAHALQALRSVLATDITRPDAVADAVPAAQFLDVVRDHDPLRRIGIDLGWRDAAQDATQRLSLTLGLDDQGRSRLFAVDGQSGGTATPATRLPGLVASARDAIGRFSHLGPLRARPRRRYPIPRHPPRDVGSRGQLAIAAMAAADAAGRRLAARADAAPQGFVRFIAERLSRLGLIDDLTLATDHGAGGDGLVVRVTGRAGGPAVSLADAGFGVSQILPAAVAAFHVPAGTTLWMEQPELHLHAAAQTALGDLMVDAVSAWENGRPRAVQIILETHSEALLNRIQRRIAEGMLAADQLAVHWCPGTVPATIEQLHIDETGEILNWPDGVFGDEMAELTARAMATARRRTQPPEGGGA